MAEIYGENFVTKGRLLNKNGSLVFYALGKEVTLIPFAAKRLPHLNFESVECDLSFGSSFVTKPLGGGKHKVNLKKSELIAKDISLSVPELNVVLEKVNIFIPQSESFQELILEIINHEISNGRFDERLENEKTPYSYEEEEIALNIYLSTKGRPYAEMMALIKEKVESGEIKRSADSLEMRVNTFKSLDKDSGLEGLGAKAQTKEIWEAYKNKK